MPSESSRRPPWQRYFYRLVAGEISAFSRYYDRLAQWRPRAEDDGLLHRFLRPAAALPALAALLFVVPELSLLCFRLLPDLPALTLAIGAVMALVTAHQAPRPRRRVGLAGLAGLALGAALYVRPDFSVVALALAATWTVLGSRKIGWARAVMTGAVVVAVAAATVVPWGLRNRALSGRFQVTGHQGDRALWWAFNEGRNLDWTRTGTEPWIGHPRTSWGEVARSEALGWIRAHPVAALELVGWRIGSHFGPAPIPVISAAATQIPYRWPRRAFRLLLIAVHEAWLMLGLAALATGWRRLPVPLVLLGALAASRLVLPGSLIPDGGRYALALMPFLACCALWRLGEVAPPSHPTGVARYRPPTDLIRGLCWTAPTLVLFQIILVARWGWL